MHRSVRLLLAIIPWLMVMATSPPVSGAVDDAGTRQVRGRILDSLTGEPVGFVTVRIMATPHGAISTKDGAFVLLDGDGDSIAVRFTHVGYEAVERIVHPGDTAVVVTLVPRQVRTDAVVVTAEDPAVPIMRRVLARKRRQDTLDRFTCELYTKFVVTTDTVTATRSSGRRDSTVFSILETVSKAYVDRPDRSFYEIQRRRQTANIPPQANLLALGTNVNAFDDEVTIVGEQITTPFADDALNLFSMTLEGSVDDSVVAITVVSTTARKAFEGTIWIDQRHDCPVEVQLRPSAAVNLPFDARLEYRQTFVDLDGRTILPEALSIRSTMQASIWFLLSPRLDISLETFASDYVLGAVFDDDLFEQRRVEVARDADEVDSAYWSDHGRLPLRPEEVEAYLEIAVAVDNPDSVVMTTFLDRFTGPIPQILASLNRRPSTGFDDMVRYNRVHGLYLGLGLQMRPDTTVELLALAGWGSADHRGYGRLQADWFLGRYQHWSVTGAVFSSLERRDNPYIVRAPLISLTTFLFGNDYGDYYRAHGWEASVSYGWGQLRFIRNDNYDRPNRLRLGVRDAMQTSAVGQDVVTVFGRRGAYRENPPAMDGRYRMLYGEIFLAHHPQRLVSRTGIGIRWEVSDPSIMPTAAAYRWVSATAGFRLQTLPLWTLDGAITGGWAGGNVPPQRFFSLESSVSGLATATSFRSASVKEFYGDRFLAISLAHNFGEVIPGLLRIPNVASFGIEFLLTGSVAWTGFRPQTLAFTKTELPSIEATTDGIYGEVGFGINRILLFFRADLTARITQRERPQFFVTLTAATF